MITSNRQFSVFALFKIKEAIEHVKTQNFTVFILFLPFFELESTSRFGEEDLLSGEKKQDALFIRSSIRHTTKSNFDIRTVEGRIPIE